MSDSEIFKEAVKLPPDDRAIYLDKECEANPELRREVESLLRAHDAWGSFVRDLYARPQATTDKEPIMERPGSVIGPYKLMEQIGEGGFGLVFVAEQQQPVRRKVALKVIKPGMDTRQIIARFEAERQALALMDHPNIAKVFDAGATESGRPFFVMELVKGVPITEYCDKQQVAPRDRLQLFISVCQAVQHAHSKGIIHRDLKPSNILVAPHDGVPVVKVIDFGVAKAIGQQLTDKTIYTRFAQMIGTPLYMSPEQAELNALDVDTRSDVYSLGVLLYELLTGTTPIDRERLATAAYEEIRRIIKEEEPPRPSTRLSTLSGALSDVSVAQKADARKLSALVKGDLDWIVMKAMEKDRARRYETASAFAADVQRFLGEEPVEACPPSTWYRFRKLARRNKATLTTAAIVAVALVLGTGISIWQAVRATRAETRAVAEADAKQIALAQAELERDEKGKALLAESEQRKQTIEERNKAQKAETEAKKQRDAAITQRKRADSEAAIAKALNDFLLYDLLVGTRSRALLDQAAKQVEGKFADQPLVEASIRYTIGDVYTRFDAYRETIDQVSRALELLERSRPLSNWNESLVLSCHYTLGEAYLEIKEYERATAWLLKYEKSKDHDPKDRRVLSSWLVPMRLAECYHRQGQYAEAESRLRTVLTLKPFGFLEFQAKCLLGAVLISRQQYAEAEPLLLAGYQGLKSREKTLSNHEKLFLQKYLPEAIEQLIRLYDVWSKPNEVEKWRKELEDYRNLAARPKPG